MVWGFFRRESTGEEDPSLNQIATAGDTPSRSFRSALTDTVQTSALGFLASGLTKLQNKALENEREIQETTNVEESQEEEVRTRPARDWQVFPVNGQYVQDGTNFVKNNSMIFLAAAVIGIALLARR